MRRLGLIASSIVWVAFIVVRWLQKQFCHPFAQWLMDTVLSTWEETIQSFIRESFAAVTRYINDFFTWVLSAVVDQPDSTAIAAISRRTLAWQGWWKQDHTSTFNAIIASETEGRVGREVQQRSTDRESSSSSGSHRPARVRKGSTPPSTARTLWERAWNAARGFGGLGPDQPGAPESEGQRRILRNGSDLFDVPSGWAVSEVAKRQGLLEDIRLGCEVAVSLLFDALRWIVRRAACMPPAPAPHLPYVSPKERAAVNPGVVRGTTWEDMVARPRPLRYHQRSNSSSRLEDMAAMDTAADVILQAGYELEEHTVTTSDGYIMQMQRIPRRNARDTVFFLHGVLDTSMGWVSNGVTGSQAFAAWDQGFDVWLGNSRANPPRAHIDPAKRGSAYWHYSVNELGLEDVTAQLDHIHVVKCEELGANMAKSSPGMVPHNLEQGFKRRASLDIAMGMRTSASDTALSSLGLLREDGVGARGDDGGESPSDASMSPVGSPAAAPGPPTLARASMPAPLARSRVAATPRSPLDAQIKPGKGKEKVGGSPASTAPSAAERSPVGPRTPSPSEVSPAARTPVSSSSKTLSPAGAPLSCVASPSADGNLSDELANLSPAPHPGRRQPLLGAYRSPRKVAALSTRSASDEQRGGSSGGGPVATPGGENAGGKPSAVSRFLAAVRPGSRLRRAFSRNRNPRTGADMAASTSLPLEDGPDNGGRHADVSARRARSTFALPSEAGAVAAPLISPARRPARIVSFGRASPSPGIPVPVPHALARRRSMGSASHFYSPRAVDVGAPESDLDSGGSDSPLSSPCVSPCSPEAYNPSGSPVGSSGESHGSRGFRSPAVGETPADAPAPSPEAAGVGYLNGSGRDRGADGQGEGGLCTPPPMHGAGVDDGDVGGAAGPRGGVSPTSTVYGSPLSPEDLRRERREARKARQQMEQAGGRTEPYRLRVVGHSLGGASMLLYAVMCRRVRRPHHIYRLILLTPAGFHEQPPLVAYPFLIPWPIVMHLLNRVRPGKGGAMLIPTQPLRYVTFKLTHDLQHIPALQELMRAGMRLLLNGDSSQWDRALQMPHYNTKDMPALSWHTGTHIIQWIRTGRFQLYDYGSASANFEKYGKPHPPDIAADYALLDIPVDIVSGRRDGIIASVNCQRHYAVMKAAGVTTTYKEFDDLGHLDFVFAVKDELRHYVLSRLALRH